MTTAQEVIDLVGAKWSNAAPIHLFRCPVCQNEEGDDPPMVMLSFRGEGAPIEITCTDGCAPADIIDASPLADVDTHHVTGIEDVPELKALAEKKAAALAKAKSKKAKSKEKDTAGKATISEALSAAALDNYELKHTPAGEAYAVPKTGPRIVLSLKGSRGALRAKLAAAYLLEHGKPPKANDLADTMTALEGLALTSDPEPLHHPGRQARRGCLVGHRRRDRRRDPHQP